MLHFLGYVDDSGGLKSTAMSCLQTSIFLFLKTVVMLSFFVVSMYISLAMWHSQFFVCYNWVWNKLSGKQLPGFFWYA